MRVLTVHNFYGSAAPSGENAAYCGERDLLRGAGCEVLEFTRHSDEVRGRGLVGALRGGFATPWNPWSARALADEARRFRPDVVHVHNTFPLISPAAFHALADGEAAVVMTLHNFRTVCASAMLLREDRSCTLCLDRRSVLPALRHACYRGSRVATAPLALSIALHRALGTWRRGVDAYVALTGFQRDVFRRAGFPGDALHVKPNAYDTPLVPAAWPDRDGRVLFVGRIGREKGVMHLLEAWRRWGSDAPPLDVVGEGPELEAARRFVADHSLSSTVRLRGSVDFTDVQSLMVGSRLLVVPSIWFEGYPMVIREAFALGVPVAASDLGSLADLVDESVGRRFRPGDPGDLLGVVRQLWSEAGALASMSVAARARYERHLAPIPNLERLMTIYAAARARRTSRLGGATAAEHGR
jgi:glycosyltransferase involved in cell wall biosynthesis